MKSTGEVMGTADSFGKAYQKSQMAIDKPIPTEGTALIDLSHEEFPDPESAAGRELIEGFARHFAIAEFEDEADFETAIKEGEIDLIISRNREPLQVAVEQEVTYFSTYPSARATLAALDAQEEPLDVESIADRPKRTAKWGSGE
jgi:carbamoyl-phosphate synthase large subunit